MSTSDPLSTLETDLAVLATPTPAPVSTGGQTASPTAVLTAVGDLFGVLEGIGDGIGAAIKSVAGDIATALSDAAGAIDAIAGQLASLSSAMGGTISDVTKVLAALQNGLSTAQSLLPGGPSVTGALQSGSAFFAMLQSMLSDPAITSIDDAASYLYQIAQELRAIGQALA